MHFHLKKRQFLLGTIEGGFDTTPECCKGPAPQVYYITLNLIFSASRQNFKILYGRFWAVHMKMITAKFQTPSFKTVGGERGDRHGRDELSSKNSNEKSNIRSSSRSFGNKICDRLVNAPPCNPWPQVGLTPKPTSGWLKWKTLDGLL